MAIGRTNAGSGGGLNKSILIVSAPTGATLTATLGDTVKTASEKTPGEYWLRNLDVGEWNLKLTLGEQSATVKYNIERFGVYRTSMAFFAATIKITYPGGSTCTCSKDDRTYTAPDTSGKWDCVVDSAGDWTVKITADGKEPTTKNVTISENGQTVSIDIVHGLLLYDKGNKFPEVTGGWKSYSGSVVFGEDYATISVERGGDCVAGTVNKIDVTGWKSLNIIVDSATTSGGFVLYMSDSQKASSYDDVVTNAIANLMIQVKGTHRLSIEGIDQEAYVGFGGADSSAQTMTFSRVWLE